ncbi:hypothetical protein GLAREA_01632 [Glarea lozoyensis ATCC 20868]|uniref:DUF5672 domain-containing protein n=1 Tax=Glarea lozoyensis (strain ATCC 20868 / MF5171) TaxID=1116229 RepID=S3CIT6_GLAL2|nr:uncharacterized protein GLAREA_01632 [Glarea lozoyensis ATCC 20868]EPE25720.1 hypothetical protein GLAREA_01632 [Glarea lozoyensis ATCC 20868]
MRIAVASLASAQSRKWILPSLWLILVFWFLGRVFNHSKYADKLNVFSGNGTFGATKAQFYDYYKLLRHSGNKTDSHLQADWMTVNVSTSNKAAVIIETRRSGGIVPLVLHFSAVLGPDWPIVIYTAAENFGSFSTSAALLRHQRAGRVVIRALADGVYFPNWNSVSDFLTTPWIWEEMAPAEHVLLFQTDSILCSNSVRKVDDFFEWDFVGAPINPDIGVGYNGGLSLRNRKTTLRVLSEFEWAAKPEPYPEDQWFFSRMKDLQEKDSEEGIVSSIKLPDMETARTFAVETIDYPHPLGLHQPDRFLKEHILSLDEWCPEYKLATKDRIGN